MKADANARPRRALLRRHRVLRMPLAVGQTRFYWQDDGAPHLQKNRWHSPEIVLMREDDAQQKPHAYWIAHTTALLRCAPERVRLDVPVFAK